MGDQGPGPWGTLLPSLPCPVCHSTAGDPVRGQGEARLHLHHLPLVAGSGHLRCVPGLQPAHEGEAEWGIRHPTIVQLLSAHPGLIAPEGHRSPRVGPKPSLRLLPRLLRASVYPSQRGSQFALCLWGIPAALCVVEVSGSERDAEGVGEQGPRALQPLTWGSA